MSKLGSQTGSCVCLIFLFALICCKCCPGILVEGIGSLLDGIMGTGNGTTSTSINVAVVGLTKVCTRDVSLSDVTYFSSLMCY